MKSRYTAYALNLYKYIVKTDYNDIQDTASIQEFSKSTTFNKLEVIEFLDGKNEAYVTFKANLITNEKDSSFTEKSRFIKENEIWFYVDGEMI